MASDLPPVYFALVMATGIVSIDARRLGLDPLSWALFGAAVLAYAVLVTLTAVRVTRFSERVRHDLRDPDSAFSFLTFVAASDVLAGRVPAAHALALIAALGCLALGGFALLAPRVAGVAVRPRTQARGLVARGNWLVAVVAVQSLALVGATVAEGWRVKPLFVVAVAAWLAGLCLYALLIGFVAARLRSALSDASVFRPDFWITMGALAISILAGTRLLGADSSLHVLGSARGPLETVLWVAWAIGTAWIPVVVAFELRRLRSIPGALRYMPSRWSMVFPLGMYAAATLAMHDELGVGAFDALGKAFFWTALVAWSFTALGLVRSLRWR